ncbi:MAG: TRAP transporter large permease [Gammaproteobacteria bacterium]|nr:TRAP transporter large permease [Gammaproteobacteria bacterium]
MEPLTVGILGMVGIIIMVLLGVRVFFAAALVGVIGLITLKGLGVGVGISGFIPHAETAHYGLSVVPMFILIGHLAFHAGLTQGAFQAARNWFGWLPGGVAVSTVFSAAGFAAVSGASTATAAVFSRIAIPEMLRSGYDRKLAAGVVAAGGTLAALIPPSAILVIYAIIVEESVGQLLVAGFLPGILTAIAYAAVPVILVSLNPSLGRPITGVTWGERFKSLKGVWGIFVVVAVILGGIYTGWMTPTESGAMGAFIVLLMALARRELNWANLKEALIETSRLTVMIFSIIWGVMIFVRFLAFAGLPDAFASWVTSLSYSPTMILIMILLAYVILGMFMDAIGMMLLTLPVVYPAVIALGFDPIWFGIILVKMVEMCLITPPIGLNCYVVNGMRPDIPLQDIFRGIWPFFAIDIVVVGLLIAYPEIVTFLPETMLKN